jgi:hypothetical protein
MKQLKSIISATLLLAVCSIAAQAQKKTTRKPSIRNASAVKTIPPLEVRTAREKTETQRDNVNFWIDKLGPVAVTLESLDAAYAKKRPVAASLAKQEDNKKKFVAMLRNLRDDLAMLESEFRTKPALRKYLVNVDGVSNFAAQAEDSAIAGKFVASKRPLREASKKLTDALAAIPR